MINLEGMYDLHVHPAPSLQKRRFTALEAVKLASEEKMAGILFLDHTYNWYLELKFCDTFGTDPTKSIESCLYLLGYLFG